MRCRSSMNCSSVLSYAPAASLYSLVHLSPRQRAARDQSPAQRDARCCSSHAKTWTAHGFTLSEREVAHLLRDGCHGVLQTRAAKRGEGGRPAKGQRRRGQEREQRETRSFTSDGRGCWIQRLGEMQSSRGCSTSEERGVVGEQEPSSDLGSPWIAFGARKSLNSGLLSYSYFYFIHSVVTAPSRPPSSTSAGS